MNVRQDRMRNRKIGWDLFEINTPVSGYGIYFKTDTQGRCRCFF